jgi:hypothetical protein
MPTKTPINGIQIPSEFVTLAMYWHAGQDDILYAVCSSGNLLLGNRRPLDDDGNRMSDEAWYLSLWDELDCSLRRLCRQCEGRKDIDDLDSLKRFQAYAEETSDRLRVEYDLD